MSKIIKRGYTYGISRERYLELRYFCLQYGSKKKEILDFQWKNKNRSKEEIDFDKARLKKLEKEIEMIEDCAKIVGAEMMEYILKSVTKDVSYEVLFVPCGRRQFYEIKRKFFKLLDEKRR